MKTTWVMLCLMVFSFSAFAEDPLRAVRPDPLRGVKECAADPTAKPPKKKCDCKECSCCAGCDGKHCKCQKCACCDKCVGKDVKWFYDDNGEFYNGGGAALFKGKQQIGYLNSKGIYKSFDNKTQKWSGPCDPPIPKPVNKVTTNPVPRIQYAPCST